LPVFFAYLIQHIFFNSHPCKIRKSLSSPRNKQKKCWLSSKSALL